MPEVEKTIRLNKAAKEFNLSMDHIVDFLSKKGVKIESNPNTKLPGDAYVLLLKEFQGDKVAKEEAQQLSQSKMRKEAPVVLTSEDRPKTTSKKDEESKEILIKNVSVAGALKEDLSKAKETAAKAKEKEAAEAKEAAAVAPPASPKKRKTDE